MVKIIRKKYRHLNEDDTQQLLAPAQLAQPIQQPASNVAQQPAQLNNQLQPVQQQNQQPAQQLQQPALPDQNQQKIANAAAMLLDDKHMGNSFWIMTVNLPEEIQKAIPEFKQGNQQAEPAIKAWETLKQNPNQETFNAFIEAFKNFAAGPQLPNQNAQLPNQQLTAQQPTQLNNQQATQQPAQQATPANNFMVQLERLKVAYNFNKALQENLQTAYKKNYYKNIMIDYFNNI